MSRRRGAALRVADAAPLFAALGDGTRLQVVARLAARGPASTTELSREAVVSRQAVSKHLEVLSRARLVRGVRQGRERIWELEPKRLAEARAYLERVSAQWDEALETLRQLVEE